MERRGSDMNTVHLVDNMIFMKGIPDKYFELAIVDVPYGIGEGGGNNHTRCKFAVSKDYKDFGDTQAPEQPFFDELIRISKNQIIWGANHFISKIPYNSPCWIVWDKDNGLTDFADSELAWTSFKTAVRNFKFRWQGMLQENMKNKEFRIHPTQKPVALYKWLLKNYAKPNDKIFDSHVGSGSSRIACYDMGFSFEGCELDPDYWKAQEERFEQHTMQGDLFSGSDLQESMLR